MGYRPDPPGVHYQPHHRATRGAPVLSDSDLSIYRYGRVFQGQIGMCVLSTVKRAVQLRTAALDGETVLISDLCAYDVARKVEAAQEQPGVAPEGLPALEQIGDTGAYPFLAIQAVRDVGLVLEEDWPGPASGRTDWLAMLVDEPGDVALMKAYDHSGLGFARVDLSNGLRSAVLKLHRFASPVMVAINADGIAERDPGNRIVSSLPTTGQNHYVCILSGEDPEAALIDNWWDDHDGPDGAWGIQSSDFLRGAWACKWSVLERAVSDVLALTGLPATLSRKGVPA
jgi:hypothetical protein